MKTRQFTMEKQELVLSYFLYWSLLNFLKQRIYDTNNYENLCMLQHCGFSHPLSHGRLADVHEVSMYVMLLKDSIKESL